MEQKGGIEVGYLRPDSPMPLSLSVMRFSISLSLSPATSGWRLASPPSTTHHWRKETTGPPNARPPPPQPPHTVVHFSRSKNHASNPRKAPPTCRNLATHNSHDLLYKLGVKFWPKSAKIATKSKLGFRALGVAEPGSSSGGFGV